MRPAVENLNVLIALSGFQNYRVIFVNEDNKIHHVFRFPNGLGASVGWFNYSYAGTYGFEKGQWELALIKWTGPESYELIYNENTYKDVVGYLNNEAVMRHLKKIKKMVADDKLKRRRLLKNLF